MDPLIPSEELQEQLSSQDPPIVIDVRGEEEYRAGHIQGAKHVDVSDIERLLAEIPKGKPVVTT